VTGHQRYEIRIPKQCSIFSAEARALLLALEHIENTQQRDSLIHNKQWTL